MSTESNWMGRAGLLEGAVECDVQEINPQQLAEAHSFFLQVTPIGFERDVRSCLGRTLLFEICLLSETATTEQSPVTVLRIAGIRKNV